MNENMDNINWMKTFNKYFFAPFCTKKYWFILAVICFGSFYTSAHTDSNAGAHQHLQGKCAGGNFYRATTSGFGNSPSVNAWQEICLCPGDVGFYGAENIPQNCPDPTLDPTLDPATDPATRTCPAGSIVFEGADIEPVCRCVLRNTVTFPTNQPLPSVCRSRCPAGSELRTDAESGNFGGNPYQFSQQQLEQIENLFCGCTSDPSITFPIGGNLPNNCSTTACSPETTRHTNPDSSVVCRCDNDPTRQAPLGSSLSCTQCPFGSSYDSNERSCLCDAFPGKQAGNLKGQSCCTPYPDRDVSLDDNGLRSFVAASLKESANSSNVNWWMDNHERFVTRDHANWRVLFNVAPINSSQCACVFHRENSTDPSVQNRPSASITSVTALKSLSCKGCPVSGTRNKGAEGCQCIDNPSIVAAFGDSSINCSPCPSDAELNVDQCICKYEPTKQAHVSDSTFSCPQCPTGSTKDGSGMCACNNGSYKFAQTQANSSNTNICKCPNNSPKPASGICSVAVTCTDGSAPSGVCCPDGNAMPVGGACCPDGSAIEQDGTCDTGIVGDPPVVDLAFPRTFNVHGSDSIQSVYTIGRADRPDYVCIAHKKVNNKEVRMRQYSAYCPPINKKCNLDKKNRCFCKALKNGKYVDITSAENGPRIGEAVRYVGFDTYCEYAGIDPLRLEDRMQPVTIESQTNVLSQTIKTVTTTVVVPPH